MNVNTQLTEQNLEKRVAEKYRLQGFEVIFEPAKSVIPFDLGNYLPDIIAKKSSDEGYIIEVKKTISQTPIDQYREIAEIVAQHHGWRFLLVTGEDVSSEETKGNDNLLTWEQMLQRQKHGQRCLVAGEVEIAFFLLWGALEAAMRQQAKNMVIPIEHLPPNSLINHLYSQGELSMEQFDQAIAIQSVRNHILHGYQTPNLAEPATQLAELVDNLITMWRI
jgi:REase_AHJR-like